MNGLCIEANYIEGCLQYKNSSECAQCHPSYTLYKGYCDFTGIAGDYDQIPGCLKTDNNNQCINCANGKKYFYRRLY